MKLLLQGPYLAISSKTSNRTEVVSDKYARVMQLSRLSRQIITTLR